MITRYGADCLAVEVIDDRMETKYCKGDIVICEVRAGTDWKNGGDVLAFTGKNNLTFARAYRKDGGILFEYLNSAYPSEFYSSEDINNRPVCIFAVAVELRRSWEVLESIRDLEPVL